MDDTTPALRSPRGTHDVLAPESARWEALVGAFARWAALCGFELVQTPLFENAALFRRGIGEGSDVVGKEMYEFADRDGTMLALRPEGTASVVRAFVQHRPPTPWRAWYATAAFRHERPQAGRYREHHQLGVEAFGVDDPDLDTEVVWMADRFFRSLGLRAFSLRVNSMGDEVCRPAYLALLAEVLVARRGELCEDHAPRAATHPLRVLDCKREACREVTAAAPRLFDHLCEGCREHFAAVVAGLEALEVPYVHDHRLVRGFDYYTRTTFEFASEALVSAQNGIGGGGRYDRLTEMLGGPPTPAIGFGMGIERILLACDAEGAFPAEDRGPEVFVVDTAGGAAARDLVAGLRDVGVRTGRAYGGRSMRAQMRAADGSGAKVAVIVGPAEQAEGRAQVRALRGGGAQDSVAREDLVAQVVQMLRTGAAATPDQAGPAPSDGDPARGGRERLTDDP